MKPYALLEAYSTAILRMSISIEQYSTKQPKHTLTTNAYCNMKPEQTKRTFLSGSLIKCNISNGFSTRIVQVLSPGRSCQRHTTGHNLQHKIITPYNPLPLKTAAERQSVCRPWDIQDNLSSNPTSPCCSSVWYQPFIQ